MKTPILIYRLGLGVLIGDYILILMTTGRKSGRPRLTAIEHRRIGGVHYIVSAWGSKADWYRNILKNPRVHVWAGRREFDGVVEMLNLDEKRRALQERWGENDRQAIRSLFRLRADPTDEQIMALLATVIIVRLRPL
jgi:deazaflavin-dependent oxidoreductase (nitroreductase family)